MTSGLPQGDGSASAEPQAVEQLMRRVVETFGSLTSVTGGGMELPNPASPWRFEQYEFVFDSGCFTVFAVPEDDTVRLVESRMNTVRSVTLTQERPWSSAIGSGVLWTWILRNQTGHMDGFQIQFGHASNYLTLQFLVEASAFTTATVSLLPIPSGTE